MILQKILKVIFRILLTFLALAALYFLSVFILSAIPVAADSKTANDVVIYLTTNGVHTDLVVPVKNEQYDWSTKTLYSNTTGHDSSFTYFAVGWGDRAFYLETPNWSDLKFSLAFRAAFGLSKAAIHATFCNRPTETADCKAILLSKAQYVKLTSYLANSFAKSGNGDVVLIKTNANYGRSDAFYEANGHYSIFYTCNTWTNNALKACGQKACVWTPFYQGIFRQY